MGKGSKWRETDFNKYYSNWEKIKTNSKDNVKPDYKEVTKKNGKSTYKYK